MNRFMKRNLECNFFDRTSKRLANFCIWSLKISILKPKIFNQNFLLTFFLKIKTSQFLPFYYQDPISVKERTKTFNRLASETDLVTNNGIRHLSKSAVKRRNSRAVDFTGRRGSCRDDESHDSSSITTIDPTIKVRGRRVRKCCGLD